MTAAPGPQQPDEVDTSLCASNVRDFCVTHWQLRTACDPTSVPWRPAAPSAQPDEDEPPICPDCPHPVDVHSSEPGVGCLHVIPGTRVVTDTIDGRRNITDDACPCMTPGTSQADQ